MSSAGMRAVRQCPYLYPAQDPSFSSASASSPIMAAVGMFWKPRRMRIPSDAQRHPFGSILTSSQSCRSRSSARCIFQRPRKAVSSVREWQTDDCPLVQEHELSAAPVVNPCIVLEARGGQFAACANDLDEAKHGDAWTSRTVLHVGLSPTWMQTVEIEVSDPDLAVIRCSIWDRGAVTSSASHGHEAFLCYVSLPACALRTGTATCHYETRTDARLRLRGCLFTCARAIPAALAPASGRGPAGA